MCIMGIYLGSIFVSECSSNCKACTYDSGTESTTCDDGQCDTKFAKNAAGECEGSSPI